MSRSQGKKVFSGLVMKYTIYLIYLAKYTFKKNNTFDCLEKQNNIIFVLVFITNIY